MTWQSIAMASNKATCVFIRQLQIVARIISRTTDSKFSLPGVIGDDLESRAEAATNGLDRFGFGPLPKEIATLLFVRIILIRAKENRFLSQPSRKLKWAWIMGSRFAACRTVETSRHKCHSKEIKTHNLIGFHRLKRRLTFFIILILNASSSSWKQQDFVISKILIKA